MKNKFKIILFTTALVGTISSCTKVVEKDPTHSLTLNNALKTIDDYTNSLSTVYNNMRGVGYYGRNLAVLADMNADNLVQTGESLVNFLNVTDWTYTPSDGTIAETWLGCYSIINDANVIINNIGKVTTASNQKQANRVLGQALAVRALVHFDLLRWFAPDYDRNSALLGVPYVKTSVLELAPSSAKPSRPSVKQVYDEIYADLNNARTLFGNIDAPINSASAKYRIDLNGVNAIHARVALYAKDWPNAIAHSTSVINALPLASRTVYPQIWRDQSQVEVAFAVHFGPEFVSRLAGDVYSPTTGTNRSQHDGNPTLFNQIDEVNDIRFSTSVTRGFSTTATVRPTTRLVVTKYLGKGTARDGVVDFKSFRTSEMFLIRAEARANTPGQEAAGLADLNTLRAARILGFTPGTETGAALTSAIALERRKELFMEGHRWFDLKRTTKSIDRGTISAPTTQAVLASGRREWAWPIPQSEVDANGNIQQNTGY
ncbi:MAG: RagB/SusD family nutrient uptake outer membrane protein [Chitinophagaceae bacterium]